MNRTAAMEAPPKRWYREPWPWILMAGPFIVIVAGFVTAWIAISTSDPLVTDDYYKKGLAVDQTIARSRLAAERGIAARFKLTSEGIDLQLVSAVPLDANPASLTLALSHPTRAGLDQTVELRSADGGRYVAALRLPASGHWIVVIEDDAQTWRLMGNVVLPALGETVIGGPSATGKGS
ncbi:MAG: FixH family protein [Rhodocyclales bacterium]|nr:FixH family protein [Rhodocyclales bacterium]